MVFERFCKPQKKKTIIGRTNEESKKNYEHFKKSVEQMTMIISFTLMKILYPMAVITTIAINFYTCFIVDLEYGAIRLPLPYWYLKNGHLLRHKVQRMTWLTSVVIFIHLFTQVSIWLANSSWLFDCIHFIIHVD